MRAEPWRTGSKPTRCPVTGSQPDSTPHPVLTHTEALTWDSTCVCVCVLLTLHVRRRVHTFFLSGSRTPQCLSKSHFLSEDTQKPREPQCDSKRSRLCCPHVWTHGFILFESKRPSAQLQHGWSAAAARLRSSRAAAALSALGRLILHDASQRVTLCVSRHRLQTQTEQ